MLCLGWNPGLHACEASTLPTELHPQSLNPPSDFRLDTGVVFATSCADEGLDGVALM